MLKIKDLCKSDFYYPLKEYYEEYLNVLVQPDDEPITDLVQANVKREKIIWIKSTLQKLKVLRELQEDQEFTDSYE